MGICSNGRRELVIPVDADGNAVGVIFDGATYRLAVDASVVLPPLSSVAINDAGAGTTELSVKTNGTLVPGTDGSALVGAVDPGGLQQALQVDAGGNLLVSAVDIAPGNTIATGANTTVLVGATTALPAIPAGTRSLFVQNQTSGAQVLIREVGGGAGTGILLFYGGRAPYGGSDGALAALEAENIGAVDVTVAIQFQED